MERSLRSGTSRCYAIEAGGRHHRHWIQGQFFDYISLPRILTVEQGWRTGGGMLFSRRDSRNAAAMERREAPRLDKAFRVFLEGDRGTGLGIARNISEGGMFIETRAPQPIGSQVRVTFPADAGEMTAIAEVRYVCHLVGGSPVPERGPSALRGMGVRFLYFETGAGATVEVH
jgi:hypothetical protein